MPKTEGLHELYYEHICSITSKTDVLESDITGNGFVINLKRKWCDLFLLSYEDKRTRNYYTSSHAIRLERLRQFRHCIYRIHPFSKFRNFWDFLIVNVFLCNKILQHHNTSVILVTNTIIPYYIGIFFEFIIILDLFVNMNTGYVDSESREIILDLKKGLVRYFSTKLFIHVASAIPVQVIIFLKYGRNSYCSLCKANILISVLRLLSIIGLYRVYETTTYCNRNRKSLKAIHLHNFLRIILISFFTMLQIVNFSDTVSLLYILVNDDIDRSSHYGYLLKMSYKSSNSISSYKKIAYEFLRVCKSLVLFSVRPLKKTYYLDLIFSLMAHLIANIFYVWCLLECYDFFCCYKYTNDHIIMNVKSSADLVKSRKLPEKVYQRVVKYYKSNLSKMTVVKWQNCLYRSLPDILQREIMLSCYRGYIMRIPYFCDWPVSVIEDIVVMLKEKIYLANDIVAELISLVVAVVVASPTPGGGGGHKHVTIHVPYKIHTIHHHHVSKVHVPVHVPVIKEVQVIKEVPIIKHVPVPIVKHVPFPVVKHVEVEKKVIVPVHHHEHHEHHEEEQHGWEGEALHGWN
ncbi:potassium/sodium hyperpolarization-activated cyclic nucleotide-gated channel 3 isoform X2 [Bombyx mori]|uniref:potassium/sodium hyperpolarization-activated cyclic nucleotide-gated channel 3 isoform X2 n=1 Tax=Bombyx mori TaxID=7091 RepID=UPI002ED45420